MAKKYKYNMVDQVSMAQEPMPIYGAALAEPEVEVEEDCSGMPCSHSIEEVRQNVLEAMEHDNDPSYWTTWEAMESRLRNKYPEWR